MGLISPSDKRGCANAFSRAALDAKRALFLSSDVSPTGQGVDHRQVQRELGEVAVQLQDPVMLTAASVRVSWTVSAFYRIITQQSITLVIEYSSNYSGD